MSLPRLSTGALVKLAVAGVAAVVLAVLVLRGIDVRALVDQGFALVREAGPWVFFLALAILPAIGAPVSLFYLAAGPAFGLAVSIPGTAAAMVVNMTVNYWLARRWLRPLVEWFLSHTRFSLPRVRAENHRILTILVRVTPGPPYFVQGFILGLMEVPFRTYLVWSWCIQYSFALCFLLASSGLMEGDATALVVGLSLFIFLIVGFHLLRRKLAAKSAAANAARAADEAPGGGPIGA